MREINSLALPDLYAVLSQTGLVRRVIELARDEDLAPPAGFSGPLAGLRGDITSMACPLDTRSRSALLMSRGPGVACGLAAAEEVLAVLAPECRFGTTKRDGAEMYPGEQIGEITGPIRQILTAERTLLNLVGRLSGVATRTRRFLEAMSGSLGATQAKLFDTRKTTPGLRMLEKYAVRCGGGYCHRIGLFDAVLIKDNHIAHLKPDELAGFVRSAAAAAASIAGGRLAFVEVEVDSLNQLEALLTLEPGVVDIILLDNMKPESLRQAVAIRNRLGRKPELEASGGVTLDTIAEIAETGVDRISVGSLTHGAVSLDVGLDIEP
ncbi:MAG: Nicotinate-nucleotide pyrophosphorylase [carboxylating] [Phycisphaerales bacterium]|nr:Nicotinate-nucleotide pyrophosphorylase [carboxylating] [Phycisphaerales bacterium]